MRALAGQRRPAAASRARVETSSGVPPWLEPLRPAGNKAITGLLASVQRDDKEAPSADLLTAKQIADAKLFYKLQPQLYPPDIVVQLRTALGLLPVGGVDDELVISVAKFQLAEAGGSLALKIDGKAGPRTLPRIFRSGLNVASEGEAFGKDVQTGVVDQWATFADAAARRDALVVLVNKKLVAAGVPPVTAAFDENPSNAGSFDFSTWQMKIGRKRLDGKTISVEDAKDTADTVWHEARHTEQWFRMAQLRAGQGLKAPALVKELGIPAAEAAKARAAPITGKSPLAVIAQGWWDSVYGAGGAHRGAVLDEIDAASKALDKARAKFGANKTAQNKAALVKAKARFDKAFAAYQNLPEENDAWATGPAAAVGVTSGSPEPEPEPEPAPAPAVIEEPAGAPPTPGESAHKTMPEKDLPE
jgi:hypothetical protein